MPRGYYIETIIHRDDNFEDAEKTLQTTLLSYSQGNTTYGFS